MNREKVIAWLDENEDAFNGIIEELDSYNGYLGDDRYYPMEEFDELNYGLTPSEVLQRTFHGGDDDTRDANGVRGEFNPYRAWFYWNGYGNLCSTDYKDYSAHLDDYFIDALIDNESRLYLDRWPEFVELLDEEDGVV